MAGLLVVCWVVAVELQSAHTIVSDNERFVAEASQGSDGGPVLEVFRVRKSKKEPFWSWRLPGPRTEQHYWSDQELFLANDGKTVVGRLMWWRLSMGPGIEPVSSLQIIRKADAGGANREIVKDWPGAGKLRGGGLGRDTLGFFYPEESPTLFAIWQADDANWALVNLASGELEPGSEELRKNLDGIGAAKALRLIEADEKTLLTETVTNLRQKAATLVGSVAKQTASRPRAPDDAYRLLGHLKNHKAKPILESRLRSMQKVSYTGFFGGEVHSSIRAVADEALARWNGIYEEARGPAGGGGRKTKPYYLGGLSALVYLPFVAPENSGAVFLNLIPDELPEHRWNDSNEVLSASVDLNHLRRRDRDEVDLVRINFDTLLPGKYKLFAVWDRRTPFASNVVGAVKAGPGDYQSAVMKGIEVLAQSVRSVELYCTNHAGSAENYYAADETWAGANPAAYDEIFGSWGGGVGFPAEATIERPLSEWMIKTNFNRTAYLLTAVTSSKRYSVFGFSSWQLMVDVLDTNPAIPGNVIVYRSHNNTSYFWSLRDSHDCLLQEGSEPSGWGSFQFMHLPAATEEFKLTHYGVTSYHGLSWNGPQPPSTNRNAEFVLRNASGIPPAELIPDSMPARKSEGDLTIELPSFSPEGVEGIFVGSNFKLARGDGGLKPHPRNFWAGTAKDNRFKFYRDEQEEKQWEKIFSFYKDRWGNPGFQLENFCRQEELFTYTAMFVQKEPAGSFLPEQVWEVPLEKVPGPGESIDLGLTKVIDGVVVKLLAVGGAGEYFFHKGTPHLAVLATEKLKNDERVVRSRTPFLSWQVKGLGFGQVCAVMEGDDPEQNRVHWADPYRSSIRHLPLNIETNTPNPKMTIIVQRAKRAEFVVRVPAR